MNKTKKLLSVLLAVVMLLSTMTVMASAARTSYQTSDNLVSLDAYSPYGKVTRLSTEERLSIFCDFLDTILDKPALNMGTLINTLGITLTINLTSVNNICATLDNVKDVKANGLVSAVAWMLGIVNDLNVNSWVKGVNRDSAGDSHVTIVTNLLKVINDNKKLITDILRTGEVDLGVASSALAGLDLSMIADIPGLIKGMIFPLFERWDDDETRINELAATSGNGGMETQLSKYVTGALTKNMSIRTYKEDVNGNCTSNHTLPGAPASGVGTRHYFEKATDAKGTYIQRVIYNPTEAKYETKEENRYYRQEEVEGSGVYVYVKTNADGSTETLKYYQDDTPALHSMQADIIANNNLIDITKNSAASLLYTFIPYVFKDMAPVVLNGSMKKILGQWFGATYNYVGTRGDDAIAALDTEYGTADGDFFTKAQGVYIWEYSDYKVINGTHYWRFEDDYYVADLSGINPYFNIINWNYNISDDFLNEFIPVVNADYSTGNSPAGYSTILQGLNDFVGKVVAEVLVPTVAQAGAADATISWTAGDNSNLVSNIKALAQTIIKVSPASIFGSNYADADRYYSMLISNDNQEVLTGIACTIVQLVMPQMILPTADTMTGKGIKVGAVLAAVLRELATQLIPNYNYDALIYSDYNTKTFVAGKTNSYWLDVVLTIGADIGIHYLRNLADMGEDNTVWTTGMDYPNTKTYAEADLKLSEDVNAWEAKVDYIVDWALSNDYEWTWKMENFVDVTGLTIDLGTVQNPWVKLGKIFADLLPIDQILNVNTSDENWLETTLRDNFVLALVDLQFEKIVGGASATGILNVPTTSVLRTPNVLSQLVTVIRDLLNGLVYKIAGNVTLIPTSITTLDAVLNQANICNVVETLLGCLDEAVANGLFDTVMPFLNFFVGWKTDAQSFVKPTISLNNPSNATYVYTGESQTIKVKNNASGMLEKHRKNSSYDGSYNIIIENITATNGSVAFTAGQVIAPGASASFTYTPSSTEGAARIEVKYQVQFKDGTAIGGDQYAYFFTYVTNTATDIPTSQTQGNGGTNWAYTKAYWDSHRYTNNPKAIAKIIDNIYINVENTSVFGNAGHSYDYTGFDANYIAKNTDTSYSGQGSKTTVALYPAWSKADADYAGIPSGSVIALGTVKWRGKYGALNKNWYNIGLGNLYFANTMDLEALFSSVADNGYQRAYFDETADAEWAELLAAMDQATPYVKAPKLTSTFASVYTQENIDAAYTRLDNAIKALAKKPSSASTAAGIETAVETAQGEKGINYQDYKLYEYFNFHDIRNDAYNRIAEYDTPKAPENRIEGSALSAAEIAELIAAEGNAKKALALNATVIAPTEEEMEAYAVAVKNYKAPAYTILDNEDLAMNVTYYGGLVIANTTNKQFLAKEIAYANAQNYDSSKYSADSWAAYTSALEGANTVNSDANALQSEVFDAKYALMKAENELLLKENSAKESGALKELQALADQAEIIFANPQYYAPVADVTEADAYAALIKALGYKMEDDSILYSRSAYEFLKYDRETTSSNLARIDACASALKEAIDNFECTIKVVEKDGDPTTTVDQAIRIINGINPGSIADMDALLAHVQASDPSATLAPTASKANAFGTGAKVDVNVAGIGTLTTYYVLIYGDVTGDGAVDGFDAIEASLAAAGTVTLDGVYETAADVNQADGVTSADYSALCGVATGLNAIDQKTGALS